MTALLAPGQNWLSLSSAYTSEYMALPVVLFDCTAIPNGPAANVGYRCLMNDTTGQISFIGVTGFGPIGGLTSIFYPVSALGVSGSVANNPSSFTLLDWIQIGLVLYGTKSRFCKYFAELIQFLDPDLDVTNTGSQDSKFASFYQKLAKQHV